MFRKGAVDQGFKTANAARQRLELGLIDGVGAVVMGAERDVTIAFPGREIREITAVELRQGGRVELIVADPVEQVDKAAVRLAVNMFEFNRDQLNPFQGHAAEKVGGLVDAPKQLPSRLLDHRRQLVQVTYHQKLHSTERQLGAAITTENGIDAIEEIGPDHADFIDHQEIKAANNVLFLPAVPMLAGMDLAACQERPEGQLEKGMKGDATGVDSRNPCRGSDHHPFVRLFLDSVQKGGFAGSGLARQKNRAVGLFNKGFCQLQFGIEEAHKMVFRNRGRVEARHPRRGAV